MPSFIEFYIAQDIADAIQSSGGCAHPTAKTHNPFNMCSIAFADLSKFAEDQAGKLEALPIVIVESENDDFELIADLLDAVAQVMTINPNDRNNVLYTFAKAKRLNLALLIKASSPYVKLCQDLGNIFGVTVHPIQ